MPQNRLNIRIRRMQSQDLEPIMAIEPKAFGSHHWSLQSFENELNNDSGCYFAATSLHTADLVGYSGFWLIGEEAHITTLAVHPNFQRQYIGESLLVNDILEAKKVGARWLTLEVRVSNEKAQNLYFKYGFKSISVRKHYYQDNDEDALVLWTENIETPHFNRLLEKRIEVLDYQFKEHPGWLALKAHK
jgi:[ribosomal protein S18]-alanine N-acetyltransferase